jgi:PKD repeat protein
LDLTDYTDVTLNFWHTYDTEPDRDYAYVEYSTNGGGSWTQAKAYTGYGPHPWGGEIISLPALDGIANARFRFRFTSNSTITADGWHVDDFALLGSTPTCITPLAPVAAFSSDSPVTLGEAMHFTDQTYGTPPLDYAWDFGDGIGSSTLANPAYTYTAYGVYTVTLAVTNTQGSDNFNQAVVVRSVEDTPFTSVAMSLVTAGTLYQDQVTSFKADLSPDWATVPFSYTLDFDDATAPVSGAGELEPFLVTHTFTTPGTFTPELSVWNRAMTLPVTSTLPVTIHPVYIDLTAVDLTLVTVGTVYSGSLVAFNLDFAPDNASKPFTYTLDFGDGGLPFTDATSLDSLPITYTYTLTGSFTVSVTAWNGDMTAPVTDTVSLTVYPPNVCVGLTQVTILGPTMGVPGIYTFTTTYQPRDASLPITYTWDNGDLLPVSMRTLPDPGTYTLTVSASNCPAVQVDDTHTIDILLPSQKVYLPLIATGH